MFHQVPTPNSLKIIKINEDVLCCSRLWIEIFLVWNMKFTVYLDLYTKSNSRIKAYSEYVLLPKYLYFHYKELILFWPFLSQTIQMKNAEKCTYLIYIYFLCPFVFVCTPKRLDWFWWNFLGVINENVLCCSRVWIEIFLVWNMKFTVYLDLYTKSNSRIEAYSEFVLLSKYTALQKKWNTWKHFEYF